MKVMSRENGITQEKKILAGKKNYLKRKGEKRNIQTVHSRKRFGMAVTPSVILQVGQLRSHHLKNKT